MKIVVVDVRAGQLGAVLPGRNTASLGRRLPRDGALRPESFEEALAEAA